MSDRADAPAREIDSKPTFATNDETRRVADALSDLITHRLELWNEPFELAIATGYFNPDGFNLLADCLEEVGNVRLLLGAEPTSPDREIRHLDPEIPPSRSKRARLNRALEGHKRDIEDDRNLLGFHHEADAKARRLVEWLRSGRVQVRRLEKRFLHGKAFLITSHSDSVLAGSSNFTYSGLARNSELNLGHYNPHVVRQVEEWYEKQWTDAEPFDLAAIYEARYETHDPYVIYLRMLFERYADELREEAEERGEGVIHLTSFQDDGVWRATKILDALGGVVVADGVGLGKSYIGGEIMRRAAEERRQRVLLIAPAALRDGPWESFLNDYGLTRRIQVVSYEELSNDSRLNPEATGSAVPFDIDDISLVLIDEAHAYRNPGTLRASVLRNLLSGTPRKELVLLTATPVNNTLWDLYYILQFFIHNDAAFSDRGIKSLREHFAHAMAASPDELSPEMLFDVLDAVVVRRTRRFVESYYPNETITVDGLSVPIQFPTPRVLKVGYDLDTVLPGFFPRFAHAMAYELDEDEESLIVGEGIDPDAPQLTLARYAPSRYLKAGDPEHQEIQLAGLLRSGLLKRFESSSRAFANTCRKMASSHGAFLELTSQGYVATGEMLSDWIATDTDDADEFIEREGYGDVQPASEYHIEELREAVASDRELLLALAEEADQIRNEDDPKLDALIESLEGIVKQAEEDAVGEENTRDHRKVIIFSYFADTVAWIHERLVREICENPVLEPYRGRIATITGDEGDRSKVLFGFAPKSSKAPPGRDQDRYDVLLTTDVLAEGVNLQQARHIINYDLPWNPMRLVQRHGRIDRIGSPYDEVFLRCFFPDQQLDVLLGLEEKLHVKIARAAASIGVETEVLPGSRVKDISYTETREEIQRLREQDSTFLEEAGEMGAALSGEHYRQELREGLDHHDLEEEIRRLPWGSGSGMEVDGPPGFVFCARVGDHPAAQFRLVRFPEGEEPYALGNTAACLSAARAIHSTPRVLPETMHRLAYDAWDLARRAIYRDWTEKTDPRNLQPTVPKALREAAEILRSHPPHDETKDKLDHALDALEQPLGHRIQARIREAMRSTEEPTGQAKAILGVVREQGLEPSPEPQPLPVIEIDDVHLVCWMALTPQDGDQISQWITDEQVSFLKDPQMALGEGG